MENLDFFTRQKLIDLRDQIKKDAEQEYNYAAMNDNDIESRLDEQFSNKLLRISKQLDEIIYGGQT